jgi:hypothetical protein
VALRHALLGAERMLPALSPSSVTAAASVTAQLQGELGKILQDTGVLCLQLDQPLSAPHFLELGKQLGAPLPETDAAVQRYVDEQFILNLVSEHRDTEDVSLQPFANNALTLHSESSGRPSGEQPRFIVLSCREPGVASSSAQTLLVAMKAVAGGLASDDLLTLSQTRYRSVRDVPTILRHVGDRAVFSFRDFLGQPLEWVCTRPGATASSVNETLRRLLAAIYRHENAHAVHWRRGMLIIIDNTFHFHGRTASTAAVTEPRRHLQRLRILPAGAQPGLAGAAGA